jgi:hypothetical protein
MLPITRTLVSSLALLFVAATAVPVTANALPVNVALHMFPKESQKAPKSVTFQILNKSETAFKVKVADTLYTLQPHAGQKITALAGAQVLAVSDSAKYHSGEVLITVSPSLAGETVTLD